jgi:hypothetical protein
MFAIESNQPSWTITVLDIGYGTNWVHLVTTSGSYNQLIYANVAFNITNSTRSVKFIVNYCNGQNKRFTLNQGSGNITSITPLVI